MNISIHPTAIVDDGAEIGEKSRIWHWAHVCAGAKIGEGVSLGQNVFVGNKVVIGDYCKIQNNVSVYDNVALEAGVFCGPSMVFTNVYNPRSLIERKAEYRNTLVKKGATLGANCTIVCGVTIGEFAFIGAGAVVNKDVKPYALMVGVPARQIGWMSEYGEQINLPLQGEGSYICPHTGSCYQLHDNQLIKIGLQVTVPDNEIEPQALGNLPPEIIERAKSTLTRMELIRNMPLPPDDVLPELSKKQVENIEAFALRDEIKGLR